VSRGLRKALGTPLTPNRTRRSALELRFCTQTANLTGWRWLPRPPFQLQTAWLPRPLVVSQVTKIRHCWSVPASLTHSLCSARYYRCAPPAVFVGPFPLCCCCCNQDPKSEPHGLGSALPSSLPFC
jgi:hypothetical protein